MMDKKFKSQSKQKWFILLFPSLPFLILIFKPFKWSLIFHVFMYTLVGITIFQKYSQVYAEVKDGKIYFFAGIGLYDPNSLVLSQITSVEKTARSLLLINYGDNKKLSIEAPRDVIDQMDEYFRQR